MQLNKQWPAFLLLVALFSRCEKNDSDKAFGNTTIFMPQATVSGGTNANYPVPSGLDSATHNYTIDSTAGTVTVLLGVSRSGLQSYQAFSVQVTTNADTINHLITAGLLDATTMLLPSDVYTLPATVHVDARVPTVSFNLVLDKVKLNTTGRKK